MINSSQIGCAWKVKSPNGESCYLIGDLNPSKEKFAQFPIIKSIMEKTNVWLVDYQPVPCDYKNDEWIANQLCKYLTDEEIKGLYKELLDHILPHILQLMEMEGADAQKGVNEFKLVLHSQDSKMMANYLYVLLKVGIRLFERSEGLGEGQLKNQAVNSYHQNKIDGHVLRSIWEGEGRSEGYFLSDIEAPESKAEAENLKQFAKTLTSKEKTAAYKQRLSRIVEAWEKGDIDGLRDLIHVQPSKEKMKSVTRRICHFISVEKTEWQLPTQRYFNYKHQIDMKTAVISTDLLVAKDGVIDLLKRKGFTVTQLTEAPTVEMSDLPYYLAPLQKKTKEKCESNFVKLKSFDERLDELSDDERFALKAVKSDDSLLLDKVVKKSIETGRYPSPIKVSQFFTIDPNYKGHFYKIQTKSGITLAYLIGTSHIVPKSVQVISPSMAKALNKCHYFTIEYTDDSDAKCDWEDKIKKLQKDAENSGDSGLIATAQDIVPGLDVTFDSLAKQNPEIKARLVSQETNREIIISELLQPKTKNTNSTLRKELKALQSTISVLRDGEMPKCKVNIDDTTRSMNMARRMHHALSHIEGHMNKSFNEGKNVEHMRIGAMEGVFHLDDREQDGKIYPGTITLLRNSGLIVKRKQ